MLMTIEQALEWMKENKEKVMKKADKKDMEALKVIKAFQLYITSPEGEAGPMRVMFINAIEDFKKSSKPKKALTKLGRKIKKKQEAEMRRKMRVIQELED